MGGMQKLLEDNREQLAALCRRFGVKSLEVIGSAATDAFCPDASDVDLLVRFDLDAPMSGLHQYVGFKQGVEALLGRPVDLVNPDLVQNRFFREAVNRTRVLLYAA